MKVLVIRLSAIGDIVLTSVVLRCIKTQRADCSLHYLTKPAHAHLLAHCPYVDKVHLFDGSLRSTLSNLRKEHFDYVLDLHNNLRSAFWRIGLGCHSSVLRKRDATKWLLTAFHLPVQVSHVAMRYLAAAAPLGVTDDGHGLQFFLPPKPSPFSIPNQPYVALVFGAQHFTKRIPPEGVRQICLHLSMPVVLLGDKGDAAIIAQAGLEWPDNVDNRCGLTTFEQSARLVAHASAVITSDTGLMHVAAAFGRPVVAVWGSTAPQLGFEPFRTEHVSVQVPDLRCRPCSKLGHDRCPRGHFKCMLQHSWSTIAHQAESLSHNPSPAPAT